MSFGLSSRFGPVVLKGPAVVNLCVGVMLAARAEVCDRLGCGERRVQCTERSKTYAGWCEAPSPQRFAMVSRVLSALLSECKQTRHQSVKMEHDSPVAGWVEGA